MARDLKMKDLEAKAAKQREKLEIVSASVYSKYLNRSVCKKWLGCNKTEELSMPYK